MLHKSASVWKLPRLCRKLAQNNPLDLVQPFRIIVPAKDKPHLVASRSYVSYGKAELQDKLDRNPYSYLHVINPAGTGKAPFKRGSEAFYGSGP